MLSSQTFKKWNAIFIALIKHNVSIKKPISQLFNISVELVLNRKVIIARIRKV